MSQNLFSENEKLLKDHCGIQVEGPHLSLGDPPFTPNSGFTPGTPVFTHFTTARRRYAPHAVAVKNKNKNKI